MTQFAFVLFPRSGFSERWDVGRRDGGKLPYREEHFAEASAALGYDLWALTQQVSELNKAADAAGADNRFRRALARFGSGAR